MPAAAAVTAAMLGSSNVEVNALGPVHEYVAPAIVLAVRFRALPSHTGLLLPAKGAAGMGFTVTTTEPTAEVQPLAMLTTL